MTSSAVQNGVPNNVTTKVIADYINGTGQSTVENQTGWCIHLLGGDPTRGSSSVPVKPSAQHGHGGHSARDAESL